MTVPFPIGDPPVACGPTLAAVQAVLDGDRPATTLDADPHAGVCLECQARIAEARVLLTILATLPEPVSVPVGYAAGVLSAVRADRGVRRRRRVLASVGGGLAVAAAVLVAVWVQNRPAGAPDVVEKAPTVRPPVPEPAPAPRPVRVSTELAKAGIALRESSLPLAEPAAAAPKVLATLAGTMLPPVPPPMPEDIVPAAESIAELPAAARTGLEPVTGTTQKAFNRLLRDVGVFQTAARPKS